jgi:dTDP-D-glucose 4,6-dehydratase
VEGVELILLKGVEGEIYNIGSENQYSVMQIAEKVLQYYFSEKNLNEFVEFVEDRPFNDCRYSVNTEKIEALGWSCKMPFSKGLANTLDWYKTHEKDFSSA